MDLHYNTNSKKELENIRTFFNILYKHIKASKLGIAKKMSGKMRFVNRRDESDERKFIPQVDGGNSPHQTQTSAMNTKRTPLTIAMG